MSRIIKNIIDNVVGYNTKEAVLFHSDSQMDVDIANLLDVKFYVFIPCNITNNFRLLVEEQINMDMSVRPAFVLITSMGHFQNALNLSKILRIPLINIVKDLTGFKKEGLFSLGPALEENINICFDKNVADQLYIQNYQLVETIHEIPNIIKESVKTWKPT